MGKHIELIARGLIVLNRQILLCQAAGGYTYLPGGHVEFGESASQALRREMQEESGLEVQIGATLACSENTFTQKEKVRHELNIVIAATLAPELFHVERDMTPPPIPSLEPDISFLWASIPDLRRLRFRPNSLLKWLESGHPAGVWLTALEA